MDKLSNEQIQQIASREIDAAEDYATKRLPRRKEAWDRYYGRPLGNEVKGRSKFITRDTMETIEWMMPFLIRTFASGDSKLSLRIKGAPPWIGQALFDKILEDLADNSPSDFLLQYQWFKDALISDTSVVKSQYLKDVERVPIDITVPVENLQKLMDDPDVKIKSVEELPGFGVPKFQVSATVTRVIEDRGVANNVPYWEFLASPDATDVNDEHPKGQSTKVTLDYLKRIDRANRTEKKKPFFDGLKGIEDSIAEETPQYGYTPTESSDGDAHAGYDGDPMDNEKYHSRSIKTVDFVEWYTRVDVDGDGFLEDIVCWLVSGEGTTGQGKGIKKYTLLRWEENKEGFIPFSAIKPIIDPYKLYGISWADLIIEIQNLHTMLLRRILDNFDFQNSGRWIVDPEANIDLKSLLENAPGTAILGKLDGIKEVTPKGFMSGTFSILEYVKNLKENRTGVRDVAQGLPDPINQTAKGMEMIYSTAMQRLELIARIFAETGISDFYKKMGKLYQKYMTKPFVTERDGVQREVTREMIQGKIIINVNMGVAVQIGMQDAQKINSIVGFLMGLNQQFPGLLTAERIHSMARKYITSTGFRDVTEFIGDVNTYVEEYDKRMQGQQEHQEKMMALQKRLEDMELMLKDKEISTKAAVEGQRIQSADVKDQRKFLMNKDGIASREKIADLNARVKAGSAQTAGAVQMRAQDIKRLEVENQRQKDFMDAISERIKALTDKKEAASG